MTMKQNILFLFELILKTSNESDIDDIFESIYITIRSNKQKLFEKGFGWIIASVIDLLQTIFQQELERLASCLDTN